MRLVSALTVLGVLTITQAAAEDAPAGLRAEVLSEAMRAFEAHIGEISNQRYVAIVDLELPSTMPRLYVLDRESGDATAYLVAHGQGSDPDHDGIATEFSNEPGSRMSSLGAYVTGGTYDGAHGLSLILDGLDPTNDNAEARAIVLHGADYVGPGRDVLGRSWGCPAVEQRFVEPIIGEIGGGALLYIHG